MTRWTFIFTRPFSSNMCLYSPTFRFPSVPFRLFNLTFNQSLLFSMCFSVFYLLAFPVYLVFSSWFVPYIFLYLSPLVFLLVSGLICFGTGTSDWLFHTLQIIFTILLLLFIFLIWCVPYVYLCQYCILAFTNTEKIWCVPAMIAKLLTYVIIIVTKRIKLLPYN